MTEMTIVQAVNNALHLEMQRDDRVVVLGQDVARSGGVFRATDGLLQRFGATRVFDTPLSEGVIAGSSIGLALGGLVPVAEIQFMGFSHNAFNQIVDQLARIRYRSGGRFNAAVTIRMPYGGGVRTPEMHSDAFEAQFAQAPGLKIVCPATPHDAKGLLLSAIRDPDPVLFLEPLRGYRLTKGSVDDGEFLEEIGKARVVREGKDCTIITWSSCRQLGLAAAEDGAEQGIDLEVIDLRSLVPLDVDTIVKSVTKTGRAVVVQEAPMTAGFASEVIATIQEEAFYSLLAPLRRVGPPDAPYPAPLLEEQYMPTAEKILEAVTSLLNE